MSAPMTELVLSTKYGFGSVYLCTGVYESRGGSVRDTEAIAPDVSPSVNPQPFLPLLAPSPLTAFTNYSVAKLSGM